MSSCQVAGNAKKKRVCLISYGNIYSLPFANPYINCIEKEGLECVLLYWDRDENGGGRDLKLFPNYKHYIYKKEMHTGTGTILEKLKAYYGATKYFNKVLKEELFDGVVILHTHAAIGCKRILKKYYTGKFIVDIRDYTLEDYQIYKRLENSIFKRAYGAVISSPAYKKFLPERSYVMAHNYSEFPTANVNEIRNNYNKGFPINIGFVGTVRFYGMDKKVLDLFGNDDRYKISYYGSGSEPLKKYSEEKGISNFVSTGTFPPSKILENYKGVTLINNLYGNHDNYLDYALSNKLYHAIQLHIPLLVCPDTYMEEIVTKYNLGFVVNVDDTETPNYLASAFQSFNWAKFYEGCDKLISQVIEENRLFDEFRSSFVRSLLA